jgi:hypothetical protein
VALVPANLLLQLWSIALNPPGRVIDHDAAFRHHLLELAVADRVFAIPADTLQDDEGMEAAELEGVHSGLSRSDWTAPPYLNPAARQCKCPLMEVRSAQQTAAFREVEIAWIVKVLAVIATAGVGGWLLYRTFAPSDRAQLVELESIYWTVGGSAPR